MVKLASARESRCIRCRWDYVNAGFYLLSTVLLAGGFLAQFSTITVTAKSGLSVILLALAFLLAVNADDLVARLACCGRCFPLAEFSVPLVNIAGTTSVFVGVLLLQIQMEKGRTHRLQEHAAAALIVGAIFWLVGSVHNICQLIYETANAHVQILNKCVQIPLLMGSLLFLVAGVLNDHGVFGSIHLEGHAWVWLCLSGSVLFFAGGLMNAVRVIAMQRMERLTVDELRGSA